MEEKYLQNVVEAVMFALGREITIKELAETLCVDSDGVEKIIENLKQKYNDQNGVELVKVKEAYQLVTNKKYYKEVSLFIQNTAYSGTDFILFSNPKFLEDILILYLGLYFFRKIDAYR